jgi:hypothetical protein
MGVTSLPAWQALPWSFKQGGLQAGDHNVLRLGCNYVFEVFGGTTAPGCKISPKSGPARPQQQQQEHWGKAVPRLWPGVLGAL